MKRLDLRYKVKAFIVKQNVLLQTWQLQVSLLLFHFSPLGSRILSRDEEGLDTITFTVTREDTCGV
jgi:hypothetical protein